MAEFCDLYTIGDVVARNDRYELFLCYDKSNSQYLYQVPVNAGGEKFIITNASFLNMLRESADYIQEKSDIVYNYHLGFPEIVQEFDDYITSFVIKLNGVDNINSVIPLIKMCKEGFRVDLQTSAWIFGKLLKIISFANDNKILLSDISPNNVLIQPDLHYVIVFDWSKAKIVGMVGEADCKSQLKKVAKIIIKILGDNLDNVKMCEADDLYIDYINKLANGGWYNVSKAHIDLYNIIDIMCSMENSNWKNGFHKFTVVKVN